MLRARRASKRALSFPGSAWECTAEIGRASCRERVKISGVHAWLKQKAVRPPAEPGDEKRVLHPPRRSQFGTSRFKRLAGRWRESEVEVCCWQDCVWYTSFSECRIETCSEPAVPASAHSHSQALPGNALP